MNDIGRLFNVIELDAEDANRVRAAVLFAVTRCSAGSLKSNDEFLEFPVSKVAGPDVFDLVDRQMDLDQVNVLDSILLKRNDGSPLFIFDPAERKVFLHLLPDETAIWESEID